MPTKPSSHGTTSQSLQKSPLHKSTSALNEMPSTMPIQPTGSFTLPSSQMSGGQNKLHPQVGTFHSLAPSGYQMYPGHNDQGYSDHNRYGYDPRFMVGGGDPYADEYDLSPPLSTVSASGPMFSPPSNNTSRRSDQHGMRETDLADEFLRHFGETRGQPHQQQQRHHIADNHTHAPPTGSRSDNSFARVQGSRRSNASDNVAIPAGSSPVTHYKRASSPNLGFPVEGQGGYIVGPSSHHGHREYSPDNHPAQYHRQHQQPYYGHEQYRSPLATAADHPHSYQTPSPIASSTGVHPSNYSHHYPMTSSAHGTPSNPSPHSNAQVMSRKAPPNHQPSPQKSLPSSQFAANSGQKRNAALWYDDNSGIVDPGSAVQGYDQHNRMSGGSHMTGHMTTGGGAVSGGGQGINHPVAGQVPGQATPLTSNPQGITMPRQHSEESYDLQEMLKIWDSSSKSPFGEGTLV